MRMSILAAVLTALASASTAAPVRVEFSGTGSRITGSSDIEDPEAAIGGSIHVGTRFTGYFTFDDAAVPQSFYPEVPYATPEYSVYQLPWPSWAFHTEIGDFATDANSPDPSDTYKPLGGYTLGVDDFEATASPQFESDVQVLARVDNLPSATDPRSLVLWTVSVALLGGAPGEPVHSTSLAGIPWNLTAFPTTFAFWSFEGHGSQVDIEGSLDHLAATAPEPGGALLAVVALLGLVRRGYRRARS